MKTKSHLAKPEHEVLYQDLCQLVNRHADKMTKEEVLAVAANMVGKLVAMQDQRRMTTRMAMELVAQNIQLGNLQVIEELATKSSGTA